jgi:hypothetical protein
VPSITSADHTTFTIGTAGTFSVTTDGITTPTITETGSLPNNVGLVDNGDGTATLSGTPAAGTAGSYPITIKATNGSDTATQSFTLAVVKAPQAITITSTPPAHPVIGDTYPITATATSALPVSFSIDGATTNNSCSLVAAVVHFDHSGSCVVDADAAGDSSYLAAPQVHQTLHVTDVATTLSVTTSKSPTVYGEPTHATATVGASGGAPAGVVQFSVDGADLGAPVTVTNGTAVSSVLTDASSDPLAAGAHQVSAAFTPTNTAKYSDAEDDTVQLVDKADSSLTVTVHSKTITAAASPVAPGAGDPSGNVTFSVGGSTVGSAPLTNGVATLHHAVKPGMTRHVGAAYPGDANFTGSSASTVRHDPTVTAKVTSAHSTSKYGWYRTSVHVSFTCTTHGAPLTTPCPAPVTLSHSGAAQSVTRTVAAADGGMATAAVHGIDIDKHGPSVHVSGVKDGKTYHGSLPTPHCVADDALSGVASCHLSVHHHGATTKYRAIATDRAGNTATVHGSYRTPAASIEGAHFSKGAFQVKLGQTYQLVVHSTKRPTYYDAAPVPQIPFVKDMQFLKAGHHRWALGVTMTHSLGHHRDWNLGIKIGKVMHVLRVHTR